jgi:hypothetical protein
LFDIAQSFDMSSRGEGAISPDSSGYEGFVNAAKAVSMNELMKKCRFKCNHSATLSEFANDSIQAGSATDERLLDWLDTAYKNRFTPEWVVALKIKVSSLRISAECWRS